MSEKSVPVAGTSQTLALRLRQTVLGSKTPTPGYAKSAPTELLEEAADEIERLNGAISEAHRKHDKLVERSVGAMTIAEGAEGHEAIPLDCPMLVAVGMLQCNYREACEEREELRTKMMEWMDTANNISRKLGESEDRMCYDAANHWAQRAKKLGAYAERASRALEACVEKLEEAVALLRSKPPGAINPAWYTNATKIRDEARELLSSRDHRGEDMKTAFEQWWDERQRKNDYISELDEDAARAAWDAALAARVERSTCPSCKGVGFAFCYSTGSVPAEAPSGAELREAAAIEKWRQWEAHSRRVWGLVRSRFPREDQLAIEQELLALARAAPVEDIPADAPKCLICGLKFALNGDGWRHPIAVCSQSGKLYALSEERPS